jgi:mRNA-degrading endonuclease YafQ of YafQ-DinJ toxin-antitoxin module
MNICVHAVVLILVIQASMLFIYLREILRNARPSITYAPKFQRDRERMINLNYIYNNNDVEIVQMLTMKRTPFNSLVNTFMVRGSLKNKWQCFFMFFGITRDSE